MIGIKQQNVSTYSVTEGVRLPTADGGIEVQGDMMLYGSTSSGEHSRVTRVNGNVLVSDDCSSLLCCPSHITGTIYGHSAVITTMEGVKTVDGDVHFGTTTITSLQMIEHTNADMVIGGALYLPYNCTHLVGLAYITGVRKVVILGDSLWHSYSTAVTLDVIHDPFLWQEKLLDMGLFEQAQI